MGPRREKSDNEYFHEVEYIACFVCNSEYHVRRHWHDLGAE